MAEYSIEAIVLQTGAPVNVLTRNTSMGTMHATTGRIPALVGDRNEVACPLRRRFEHEA